MITGVHVNQLKKFYNTNKVVDIDHLVFEKGSVYGLIGTNGAGKSTLLRMIAQDEKPSHGTIDLQRMKPKMLHHEIGLFQEMRVYESVFLGREEKRSLGPLQWIKWNKVKEETKRLLTRFDLDIDPSDQIKHLEKSAQKLLEIAIVISQEPDVLIIDEPLTLLDDNQINILRSYIKDFMNDERIVIYSSHRIDELVKDVDKVITMRDGHVVEVLDGDTKDVMSLWEFSEKDVHKYPKRKVDIGPTLLKVVEMNTEHLSNLQFSLAEGEILGIVGLKGSYKDEIGKALFGTIPSEGHVYMEGRLVKHRSTQHAVESGICYVGHDQEGLFPEESVYENVIAANSSRGRRLKHRSKKIISKYYLDILNVDEDNRSGKLASLSAGNKQKVLLAKWFFSYSRVFIFNKPTANIDTPSKVDIYNIFMDLVESGAGLVVISNDLEEVAGICDRVLVFSKGNIQQEIKNEELSVHKLVESMQNWA